MGELAKKTKIVQRHFDRKVDMIEFSYGFPTSPRGGGRVNPMRIYLLGMPLSNTSNDRRGFTLLELLVVILVISILIGIIVPAMARAKSSGIRTACVSNVRQIGLQVSNYTLDHRDYFPSWYKEPRGVSLEDYHLQGISLMLHERWAAYIGSDPASGVYHCPSNARGHRSLVGLSADGRAWTRLDYALSSAFWIDPPFLNPAEPPEVMALVPGGRVQRISSVHFPSQKVGAYEDLVYHGWTGPEGPGADMGSLSYMNSTVPGSVQFLDGHAKLIRSSDAVTGLDRQNQWWPAPYQTTPWGIFGRDFE